MTKIHSQSMVNARFTGASDRQRSTTTPPPKVIEPKS